MSEVKVKTTVVSGLAWKFLENGGTQGVQFLVSVILARLVAPEEYAGIALITIFIAIANVLIQNSFNTALIQNQDVTEIDYSSVFYLNLMVACILYLILYTAAPFIAGFYQIDELSVMLRVLAITLFFGAVLSVQNAIVIRAMNFKKLCIASFLTAVGSGVAGIVIAYCGYGVWALVVQQLGQSFFLMVLLGVLIPWRPKLIFSVKRVKVLFSFGWKLLCSGFIDTIYTNAYGLVIGRVYDPAMLAFYNRGNQFPFLIASNVGNAIQSVMLPTYSRYQNDRKKVKEMVRQTVKMGAFVMFPLMMGMIAVADSMIVLLLTDKWRHTVPFLRILCISYMFWPIHVANLQAMNALGRSDLFLKLEIIKKVLGVLSLVLTIPYGVYVMVIVKTLMEFVCFLLNVAPNRKLLNYGAWEQLFDMIPAVVSAAIMGFVVYLIQFLIKNLLMTLLVQILAGVILYLALSCFFNRESTKQVYATIRQIGGRK